MISLTDTRSCTPPAELADAMIGGQITHGATIMTIVIIVIITITATVTMTIATIIMIYIYIYIY